MRVARHRARLRAGGRSDAADGNDAGSGVRAKPTKAASQLRSRPAAAFEQCASAVVMASAFRDLVAGEVLEDAHEAGMVPALAAERGGGVEQFLRRRGVRQGQV